MTAIRLSLSAVALLAGLGLAAAQQNASDPNQQAPANPLGDGPFKSQQNAKEEPGSHSSGTPTSTAVLVDGKLAVPGAPADSQTVPAKFSTRNASLDTLPTMAQPLPLSDEQKQRIAASITKANPPVAQINAKPSDFLPADTKLYDMPADIAADIPFVRDLKYVRLPGKIALVGAANMVVVGEIAAK
jgi:hypothetical protein